MGEEETAIVNSNMSPALMVKSHSIACRRLQHTSVPKSINAVCLITQVVLYRSGVSRPSFDSVTQPLRVFPNDAIHTPLQEIEILSIWTEVASERP